MRMGIGLGVGINRSNYAQGIFNAYSARVVADGGVVESGSCVDAVSSLLQSASLLLIPSGYKGGKLYSEIPTNGNGDLTWTRGSDAFRTNASGVIQRVPWNLLQYSEDFSNGVYTKVATTITSNTTNAPNGTLTADKLVSTSVSSSHSVYQNLGSVGDTRVISCFVKKAEYRYVNIQYGTASVRFDFDTLTFSGGTSNSYTDEGGGWYRISSLLTATVNARVTILIPDNSGNVTYTGDDVSGTFIWGFQAVEGTTAQTYLPTTDRLNFPRLSYMYGSCPSVLLEPQRTNLALYSEQFDNASWTKDSSATVTANTTTAPDGNTTADTINLAAVANSRINQVININNSTTYTVSGYFKNIALASGENISLIYGNTNSFSPPNNFTATASIDLFNGTATYSLTGTSGTGFSGSATGSIQNVGNGWYRVSLTFTTGTAAATGGVFRLISSTVASARSFYAWGMQMEVGAYPTTYIPTTSATATRVADSFSRNNIYTNGLISASGGTWFVEFKGNNPKIRDGFMTYGLTDVASNNGFYFNQPSGISQRLTLNYYLGGSATTNVFVTTTDNVKLAIKWNGSTADIFQNGVKVVSNISFAFTQMQILNCSGVGITTFIQQMALFPTPLSDTDCATITT